MKTSTIKKKSIAYASLVMFLIISGSSFAQFNNLYPGGTTILYNSQPVGIQTPSSTLTANSSLDLGGNLAIRGTHLIYNSANAVIDWGSSAGGNLLFRRLTTQGVIGGFSTYMIIQNNGNVGIGSAVGAPVTLLHVGGDVTFGSATNKRKWRFITQNWIDGGKMFLQPDLQDASGNPDQTQGMAIDPIGGNCIFGNEPGTTNIAAGNISANNTTFTNGTSYIGFNAQRNMSNGSWASHGTASANGGGVIWGNTEGALLFSPQLKVTGGNTYNDAAVFNRKTMEVRWDYTDGLGQVIIGTKTITTGTNTNFRLSVDGKIMAKEVYVVNDNTWADYVFNKNYKLKSLKEVEEFIALNKHLPNVPSASEIAANGNNLGETEKILLEKIEELTLYVIAQNKRIEELEKIEKK